MPRVRIDGGLIGLTNTPTSASASGMWAMKEHEKFIRSSSWPAASPSASQINVVALVVAGGGGGSGASSGSWEGGGGGAGGLIYATNTYVFNTSNYTVTIGAGGAGGAGGSVAGSSGSNSTFNGLTAIGGGNGSGLNTVGGSGGSGGGSWGSGGVGPGSGTAGQGNAGGGGNATNAAGGGGGAGATGGTGSAGVGGAGGAGLYYSIIGSNTAYAGGGGGSPAGTGGVGGGGTGGSSSTVGAANTGGGGGGGVSTGSSAGKAGGSGVVIINYPAPQQFSGGYVTNVNNLAGSNIVHTFTTSGTLTALNKSIDTYFNYNTLLLHGDGTSGSNNSVFVDSSTNNLTITRNGTPTQGTFSPFATTGWSNYFNGSSYLSLSSFTPVLATTSTPFTIEGWVYYNSYPSNAGGCIFTSNYGGSGNVPFVLGISNGNVATPGTASAGSAYAWFGVFTGSAWQGLVSSSSLINLNTWYHIAVSYDGTTFRLFVNGNQVGTATSGITLQTTASTTGSKIGIDWGTTYNLTGYVSNVRFVNGTALYSSSFNPLINSLTVTGNTALLTCANNTFIGSNTTVSNVAITTSGSPQVQPFSPFSPTAEYSNTVVGGSVYFNGTTDYLSTSNSSIFTLGAGDHTIEFWVYMTKSTRNDLFYLKSASPNQRLGIYYDSATSTWRYDETSTVRISSANNNSLNAWHHIALSRASNVVSMYVDGSSIGTYTSTQDWSSTSFYMITGKDEGGSTYLGGYLANLRLIKGTSLYSGSTITVPTAPLTAVANTIFLLNATNAGIIDSSQKNTLITYGSAATSSTQSKFGGTSMYFDGGNTAYCTAQTALFATGTASDFTAECWAYPVSLYSSGAASPTLMSIWAGGTAGWQLCISTTGVYLRNSTTVIINTGGAGNSVTTGQWYHVALVRYNGTLTLYLNGTSVGSTATSYNFTDNIFSTGSSYNNTSTHNFYGYIDDLHITKGIARYTTNFTPPTSAFLNQ